MAIGTPSHDPLFDSTARLRMVGEGVDTIIHEMTGTELKIVNGVTWLELPNGIRLVPAPFIRIQGTSHHLIRRILAPDHPIAQALQAGILYKREVSDLPTERSSVSFIIQANPIYPVVMEVSIGRDMGDEMSDKITKEL